MEEKKLVCDSCLREPVCTGYRKILQPVKPEDCAHFVRKEHCANTGK